MADYMFLKGCYVGDGFLGTIHRYKCKKCGSFIESKRRTQNTWSGKKTYYICPYCPKCGTFKVYKGMYPVQENWKPYG